MLPTREPLFREMKLVRIDFYARTTCKRSFLRLRPNLLEGSASKSEDQMNGAASLELLEVGNLLVIAPVVMTVNSARLWCCLRAWVLTWLYRQRLTVAAAAEYQPSSRLPALP